MAGAAEMLSELARSELYLAVVSNKTGAVLRREAEHLGWTAHFSRAGRRRRCRARQAGGGADTAGARAAAASPCAEAWYVGDTALDMECARNAGCLGVLLGGRALEEDSFARFPPDLHFSGCAALARHVGGL